MFAVVACPQNGTQERKAMIWYHTEVRWKQIKGKTTTKTCGSFPLVPASCTTAGSRQTERSPWPFILLLSGALAFQFIWMRSVVGHGGCVITSSGVLRLQ
jgi:hypothetical protein